MPAGFEQKRVFRQALSMLPQGVEKVRLRSDSVGYPVELLRDCAEGHDERFGVIEFAIACPVTSEFKDAASVVAGRVIHHGRRPVLRVSGNGHLLERLLELRRGIGALAQPPPARNGPLVTADANFPPRATGSVRPNSTACAPTDRRPPSPRASGPHDRRWHALPARLPPLSAISADSTPEGAVEPRVADRWPPG